MSSKSVYYEDVSVPQNKLLVLINCVLLAGVVNNGIVLPRYLKLE